MKIASYPLVSVIIPTFNRGYCIERAIQSVLHQTFKDWELIIIDNNSTDQTLQLVKNFNDERISVTQAENFGIVAKSRNIGIKLSRGSYLAFLDSDDWWMPNKLQISIDILNTGYDLVYHDLYSVVQSVDKGRRLRILRSRHLSSCALDDLLLDGNAINNSSVVTRKSAVENSKGFSESRNLIGSEDYDLWLRLAKEKHRFKKIDGTLGYYWSGGGNLSSAKLTNRCNVSVRRLYKEDFNRLFGSSMPGWMLYSSARALISLSRFSLARKLACMALLSKLPLSTKVKAMTVWFLASIKYTL